MKRRNFVLMVAAATGSVLLSQRISATSFTGSSMENTALELTNAQWKERLTDEEYFILREEGTERPHSSILNDEKRIGIYVCVGCDSPLFTSEMKYDSKTGWPSFFDAIPERIKTKVDFKMIIPRTEYHCAKCGGHHGHVFKDGPQPTGKRYCNNGIALRFIAS